MQEAEEWINVERNIISLFFRYKTISQNYSLPSQCSPLPKQMSLSLPLQWRYGSQGHPHCKESWQPKHLLLQSQWMSEFFSGVWSSPEALLPSLPFLTVPLSFCNHTAWWLRVWALVLTAWTAQLVLPLINLYANDRFLRLSVPPLPKMGTTMIIIISISQGYYED